MLICFSMGCKELFFKARVGSQEVGSQAVRSKLITFCTITFPIFTCSHVLK